MDDANFNNNVRAKIAPSDMTPALDKFLERNTLRSTDDFVILLRAVQLRTPKLSFIELVVLSDAIENVECGGYSPGA